MTKTQRIFVFLISAALLFVVFRLTTGAAFPKTEHGIVMFTALLMISFVTLFLEHYFTTPTDVILSTIAILLLIAPLHDQLERFGVWYWLFFAYNAFLLLVAQIALLLVDQGKTTQSVQNRLSSSLKRFATYFGNGRFLFFSLFMLTLVFYVDNQSRYFLILGAYATVILLIDPKRFILDSWKQSRSKARDVGEIIGVQANNTFLARLFADHPSIKRYDYVAFRHSMDDAQGITRGVVVDHYLLDEQQWLKILATPEIRGALAGATASEFMKSNIVYKLDVPEPSELFGRFVGVVCEGSNIGAIRFDYAGRVPVSEGNLVEAQVRDDRVLFQIVQGITGTDPLEQKNEAGKIVGEAVQLGVWNPRTLAFDKFGWVPEMNSPVFLTGKIGELAIPGTEEKIGTIPGTDFPVLLNVADAISHHLAVLGVTGSGKSVFCRNLIRRIVARGIKVICVDFTGEYGVRFPDLALRLIAGEADQRDLFDAINKLAIQMDEFPNKRDQQLIAACRQTLKVRFKDLIEAFLNSADNVAIFDLPDVSNTTGILEYTKWFFRALFRIARERQDDGQQICVVLEEAHTIIPEWNFIGIEEKKAQSLVNSIGQIALQGRKYRVGFLVVAQRTANVSKTVLTQCNSIVAFQQFDKTSGEFLSNYMGDEMVAALTTLKPRQAIAVGKAFRSGVPLIFQVPIIDEPLSQ
jgi:uncharacterized protein